MASSRSSLIDIDDMITSIWPAFKAGIMPSRGRSDYAIQSRLPQTAPRKSISQPTQLPLASGDVKGGYSPHRS